MYLIQRFKCVIYDLIIVIVKLFSCEIHDKTLLIIRTNEIGDYILWRSMFSVIRNSKKYSNYKITLLGNESWENLFNSFDRSFVDETIWLNKKKYKRNILYRFKFLLNVRKLGFSLILNTVLTRSKREDDSFVLVSNKSYKIGSVSDNSNMFFYEVGYDKKLYNHEIDVSEYLFEFYKNKHFTEKFIDQKISDLNFNIEVKSNYIRFDDSVRYFIVFTGSSRPEKIWPIDNFVEVSNHIYNKYKFIPVLCGSASDRKYVDKFKDFYDLDKGLVDLCGKTSLLEFACLLKDAEFLISIDTGAVHIAATVGCAVFGIFNGTRLGRFSPYPTELAKNIFAIFPDEVDVALSNKEFKKYQGISLLPYSLVSPEKVIKRIDEFLNLNYEFQEY